MLTLNWRFDLDSITCVETGLPPLLQMASRYGVKLTLYINIGRSIDRWEVFKASLRKTFRPDDFPRKTFDKMSLRQKIEPLDMVRTLMWNPPLLASKTAQRNIERALEAGHEVGMHGGRNHGTWLYQYASVSPMMLDLWLDESYDEFCRRLIRPLSFASPGFKTNDMVRKKLCELGFTSHGDDHGEKKIPYIDPFGLHVRPVTMIGDGTVPLIEQGLSRQMSEDQIVKDILAKAEQNSYRLIYGHPYVEGRAGLKIVERVMKECTQ